ncbi:MAG: hypothetical protein ACOCYT_03200 [Chloroflexota bacterium]
MKHTYGSQSHRRWIKTGLLLLLGLPFLLLARTVALFQLSFYYMIPLLPLLILGVGAAFDYVAGQVDAAAASGGPHRRGRRLRTGALLTIAARHRVNW